MALVLPKVVDSSSTQTKGGEEKNDRVMNQNHPTSAQDSFQAALLVTIQGHSLALAKMSRELTSYSMDKQALRPQAHD
jgi:hypothetical protein